MHEAMGVELYRDTEKERSKIMRDGYLSREEELLEERDQDIREGHAIWERESLIAAIEEFVATRGKHDGDHVFCCTNRGRCLKCEESYVLAEAKLDEQLKRVKRC